MTQRRHTSKIASQPPDGQASDDSVEVLLRLLIDSVIDYAIFVLDPTGRILSWNPGAQRLKGYTADEIVGQHFSVFYPPEAIAAEKPDWELQVARREGRVEDEGWRVRKDGSRFWANVVITALRDVDGQILGFAKVTRDLTARREAEEAARQHAAVEAARLEADRRSNELTALNDELQQQAGELEAQIEEAQQLTEEVEQSNEALNDAFARVEGARAEAEAANRAKADFLRTMSHELRTPLNAIGGYVQILELGIHGPVTPAQIEDLQRIQRSQRHLLSIINDVLNYARVERGAVIYAIEPVLVAQALAGAIVLIEPQRAEKGVALVAQLPEAAGRRPHYVLADPEKLEQILLNLLSNAVKFTPAGGTIRVHLEATANARGQAVIRVSDTGIGIPADRIGALFEPFVQIGRGLTTQREGTGLGLAISRDLSRAMGGELTVESTVGAGSTFTLVLPSGGHEAPQR